MQWILLVVVAGIGGADVIHIPMTEPQCREAVRQLHPLEKRLQAACLGPNGEVFSFLDLSK